MLLLTVDLSGNTPIALKRAFLTYWYSPQDQAILEAEYKSNPKPNKAARAEIVQKVSLNEKEVQVSRGAATRLHRNASCLIY